VNGREKRSQRGPFEPIAVRGGITRIRRKGGQEGGGGKEVHPDGQKTSIFTHTGAEKGKKRIKNTSKRKGENSERKAAKGGRGKTPKGKAWTKEGGGLWGL